MPSSRFNAAREIATKSEKAIERETALKWAARAAACFERAASHKSPAYLQRGRDYHHEALEHGALVHDGGKLVGQIDKKLTKALKKASAALGVRP